MGRKSNTPYEVKLAAVEAYERNEGSLRTISARIGIDESVLRNWLQIYRSQGDEGLLPSKTNKHWSKEIKLLAVQEYLTGKYSLSNICKKYNLSFIVDAISSFLADKFEMDKYNVDCTIVSTQKALSLSPGLSIIALSNEFYEKKFKTRGNFRRCSNSYGFMWRYE